jgi:molecular chaperone GrpE
LKEKEAPQTQEVVEEIKEPSELEVLQGKYDELNDRLLRTMAEYDNFRKRSQKEKESIYPDAIAFAVAAFLPVMDNFERALEAECQDENFKKGIEMTYNQLCDAFKKLNVEVINPENEPFNPDFHNAVMHVEDESVEESVVTQVFQKGYKIGDKVIRFAMVKVAN